MTNRLKYIVAALFLSVLVAVLGVGGWLLGTTDGARWAMAAVSRYTPYAVSVHRVEGRLWGSLRLEDAHLQWPRGDARCAGLRLRWHPSYLLAGKVAITELALQKVHIQDNSPSAAGPPELTWPKVTGLPAWLNMRIGMLQVDGLEYRKLDGKPFVVDRISARLMWQGNLLTVWNLALSTPAMQAEGAIMAGFRSPSLLLKLAVIPARPIGGFNKISCKARLFPAGDKEQVTGPVVITGLAGEKQLLGLSGEIGITRNSLNLRKLRMEQAQVAAVWLTEAGP